MHRVNKSRVPIGKTLGSKELVFSLHPAAWKTPRWELLPVPRWISRADALAILKRTMPAPIAENIASLQKPVQVPFFGCFGALGILFEQQVLKNAPSPFSEELGGAADRYVELVRSIAESLCRKRFDRGKRIAALCMIADEIKSTVGVARGGGFNFISDSLEKGNWSYESLAFLAFDVCRSLRMEPRMIDAAGRLFVAIGRFVIAPAEMLRVMERKTFDMREMHICCESSDAVKMRYVHHLRIASELQEKRNEGAFAEIARAQKLSPNCICTHLMMARLFERQDDFRNALAWYNEALKISPKDWEVISERAQLLERFGDLYGAQREYKRLMKMHPGKIDCWISLLHVETLIAEKEEEDRRIRECAAPYMNGLWRWNYLIEKDRLNPALYVGRARFFWGWRDTQRALSDYSYALALNPNDARVLWERASLCGFIGDYRSAIEGYMKAHGITGDSYYLILAKLAEAEWRDAAERAQEKQIV